MGIRLAHFPEKEKRTGDLDCLRELTEILLTNNEMDRPTYIRLHMLGCIASLVCTGSLPDLDITWRFDVKEDTISTYRQSLLEVLRSPDLAADGWIDGLKRAKLYVEGADSATIVPVPRTAGWLETVVMVFLLSSGKKPTRPILQEPVKFPIQDAHTRLNEGNNFKIKVFELGKSMKDWETVLSPPTGRSSPVLLPGTQATNGDLLTYLGVTLSPLHPTMRAELAPEYVHYHDQVLQFYPQDASKATVHLESPFSETDIAATTASTSDHDLGDDLKIREYNPSGYDSAQIVHAIILVWFAGGGWMLGGPESDCKILGNICNEAQIRVFNVAYRRKPFPAPLDDAARAVKWVQQQCGPMKIILGGVSAGALLAVVTTLEMSRDRDPPLGMLLIAPSLINTSDSHLDWAPAEAPWLTPGRMKLFQDTFLPESKDRLRDNWRTSPVYAPRKLLVGAQRVHTFIASMGCDILREDAARFVDVLNDSDCNVTHYFCPSYPHMAWAMQGTLGETLLIRVLRFIELLESGEDDEEVVEMKIKTTKL